MTWKVAVATPTFKRPGTLRRCLGGTAAMHQPSGDPVELVVVVVDNDPEGSAREVATGAAEELGLDLTYVVESNRGLVAVRNRLVAEVRALGAVSYTHLDVYKRQEQHCAVEGQEAWVYTSPSEKGWRVVETHRLAGVTLV